MKSDLRRKHAIISLKTRITKNNWNNNPKKQIIVVHSNLKQIEIFFKNSTLYP